MNEQGQLFGNSTVDRTKRELDLFLNQFQRMDVDCAPESKE